jgi:hypothetical protein
MSSVTVSSVTVSGITDMGNDWSSNDLLGNSVDSWGSVVDGGLESVNWVSNVVDSSVDTIGLEERVASLHDSTVSGLMSRFDISGVSVLHSIRVLVLGISIIVNMFDNWGDISMSISSMSMMSMSTISTMTVSNGRDCDSKSQNDSDDTSLHS